VPWEQKFAGLAKEAVEQEKGIGGSGQSVKFGAGGTITVAGGIVPGNKLEVIVLASCFENAWYGGRAYDPDDPQPPECYGFNVLMDDLAPHEECQNPQSKTTCAECEKNEWGSADVGRGKACGNKKRLAIILAKDVESAEDVASAELATARVSPTQLKAWAGYVRSVAEESGRPPWSVITEISGLPDSKTQYRLEFKVVETIDDPKVLDALYARAPKAEEFLQQPYGPPIERAAKPARAGKSQKFAARGRK
jgi:hypothetical protein